MTMMPLRMMLMMRVLLPLHWLRRKLRPQNERMMWLQVQVCEQALLMQLMLTRLPAPLLLLAMQPLRPRSQLITRVA